MEGTLVPLNEDLLGFCTDCNRVRWLAVMDGRHEHPDPGTEGFPFGTCRQCAREAQEG